MRMTKYFECQNCFISAGWWVAVMNDSELWVIDRSTFVEVKKKKNQLKTGEKKKSWRTRGGQLSGWDTSRLQFTAVDTPFNQSESLLRRQGSDLLPVSQLRNTSKCVLCNHGCIKRNEYHVQIWRLIQSNKSCPKRLPCFCGHRCAFQSFSVWELPAGMNVTTSPVWLLPCLSLPIFFCLLSLYCRQSYKGMKCLKNILYKKSNFISFFCNDCVWEKSLWPSCCHMTCNSNFGHNCVTVLCCSWRLG